MAAIASIEADSELFQTPCGDGKMVWRRWGRGSPLLLLHGAHGCWMHWIRNIRHLANSHTVWIPDIPGFGESASPPETDHGDAIAEPVVRGVRALIGADDPIDIAGFSFGGTIGAHAAALAPSLFRRLVLVDSGGLGTPMGKFKTASIRQAADVTAAHRENLGAMMIHKLENLDDLAVYIQSIAVPRARVDVRPLVLPDMLAQVIGRIEIQVDAIWGEYDKPHPYPERQFEALRQLRPDSRFCIVPDAGHWSNYENAPAFHLCLGRMLA
jgi:pimeloyl-ACP methyl ester carboxylesterase